MFTIQWIERYFKKKMKKITFGYYPVYWASWTSFCNKNANNICLLSSAWIVILKVKNAAINICLLSSVSNELKVILHKTIQITFVYYPVLLSVLLKQNDTNNICLLSSVLSKFNVILQKQMQITFVYYPVLLNVILKR